MGWSGPSYQQSFGMPVNQASMSEVAQGKQRAQEDVPAFDDAAFEAAFAQAQADAFQEAETLMREEEQHLFPVETNPTLSRLRDQRQCELFSLSRTLFSRVLTDASCVRRH